MLFLACFCASQHVQRRKAELTLAQIRESYQTAGLIGTTFGTHLQIHMGLDIRQTNCSRDTRGALGGFLGGQQFKSIGKLSDWHQLWFTSADSSGNGHRLNTIRPTIPQARQGKERNIINSSASAPLKATKIAVKKVRDVDVCMFGPEL